MQEEISIEQSIPVGVLGIIAMKGCEEIGEKINNYLISWRKEIGKEYKEALEFNGYIKDNYLIECTCPRFGTGEGKAVMGESVRGLDIFIIVDVFNYGCTYKMYDKEVPMSPDDHFQDLKRVIAAIGGKARRITVFMPMLYEGRQHKRAYRESLDCAMALQELVRMGVDNIITFDAHDARVQNAIPLSGFENVHTTYQMIKAIVKTVPDFTINPDKMMIISPDEGAVGRSIYFSTILGVNLGMFYKRRDYTTVVKGRNPIVAHEFLGESVEGKDVIIVDDMIASGDSVLDIARNLKSQNVGRVFITASFGLFTEGLEKFDKAYEDGLFEQIFTTNLIYCPEELNTRKWHTKVEMSKFIAYIIETLNHDKSISKLLDPSWRIHKLLEKHNIK